MIKVEKRMKAEWFRPYLFIGETIFYLELYSFLFYSKLFLKTGNNSSKNLNSGKELRKMR